MTRSAGLGDTCFIKSADKPLLILQKLMHAHLPPAIHGSQAVLAKHVLGHIYKKYKEMMK